MLLKLSAFQIAESLYYRRTSTAVYCTESQHPQGHTVIFVMLRRAMTMHCISKMSNLISSCQVFEPVYLDA